MPSPTDGSKFRDVIRLLFIAVFAGGMVATITLPGGGRVDAGIPGGNESLCIHRPSHQ